MVADIKLKVQDEKDLAVLSAYLQDSLVPLAEMQFLRQDRRFVMLLNRFCWETLPAAAADHGPSAHKTAAIGDASFTDESSAQAAYQRIHCGLCIDHVLAVRSRDIDLKKSGAFLSLLALQVDRRDAGPVQLSIYFSGGGILQFDVERLSLFSQDFGEAWPTHWRPRHPLDEDASS